jgi:hypothetical protein
MAGSCWLRLTFWFHDMWEISWPSERIYVDTSLLNNNDLKAGTNVSEKHSASFFKAKICFSEILAAAYKST